MCDAARVIYTAAPIVEGGPDPIAKRWLLLDGEPFARVPDLSVENLFTPRARPAPRPDAAHWVIPEAGSVEEVPPPNGSMTARSGMSRASDTASAATGSTSRSGRSRYRPSHATPGSSWPPSSMNGCAVSSTPRGAVADPGKNAERKEMARRALADAIGKVAMERAGEEELEGAPLPTLTADEAGEEVARLLGGWFGSLADKAEPSEAMLTASLGVGKTHCLADALAAWAALNPTRRALVRVPTHELAADLRDMIEARSPGISGVHLGLERADPDAEGELMCRRGADVTTARRAGGSVATICGSPKRGLCPHHPGQSARREAVRLPTPRQPRRADRPRGGRREPRQRSATPHPTPRRAREGDRATAFRRARR